MNRAKVAFHKIADEKVNDECAQMVILLPEKSTLDSPLVLTVVGLQDILMKSQKKTLTDQVKVCSATRQIFTTHLYQDKVIKEQAIRLKSAVTSARYAVAVIHCLEKQKEIEALSGDDVQQKRVQIAERCLADLSAHKLFAPKYYLEFLEAQKKA